MALDTVRETGSKNMELYIQLIPNCSLFILQVYLSWQDSHLANVCGAFSQVPGSVVGTESSVLSSPPLGTGLCGRYRELSTEQPSSWHPPASFSSVCPALASLVSIACALLGVIREPWSFPAHGLKYTLHEARTLMSYCMTSQQLTRRKHSENMAG